MKPYKLESSFMAAYVEAGRARWRKAYNMLAVV